MNASGVSGGFCLGSASPMRLRSAQLALYPVSITRWRPAVATSIKVALVLVTMAALGACAGQGEGQLCNPKAGNSGNDDCQSGLTCQSRPMIVMSPYGICCQPNGQSTTTACSVNGTSITDASPAPPPEASVAETNADAPVDSADAGVESADAPGASAAEAAVGTDASDAATE